MTAIERLRPIAVDDTFRAMCEFDAERAELFFSRAAILVEGMTEKMALPFVFHALGHDADREQISIVECGGKANMPMFVEICGRAHIPYVVVHDSDMRPDREPVESEVRLNALIRRRAGARRTILLEPDFEGVLGFRSKRNKPERAWARTRTRARATSCRRRSSAPSSSPSHRPARSPRRTASSRKSRSPRRSPATHGFPSRRTRSARSSERRPPGVLNRPFGLLKVLSLL